MQQKINMSYNPYGLNRPAPAQAKNKSLKEIWYYSEIPIRDAGRIQSGVQEARSALRHGICYKGIAPGSRGPVQDNSPVWDCSGSGGSPRPVPEGPETV